jgi:diaminohydroxyphosphoribosylaminopyrimidine deaminase/5-amino-6-(5-phosphoribosylamino)uracil reductase
VQENMDRKTHLLTSSSLPAEEKKKLFQKGVKIIQFSQKRGLKGLLQKLGKMEICSILVEGGSEVFTSFFTAGLVDRILVFIAPIIIGSGKTAFQAPKIEKIKDAFHLKKTSFKKFDDNILVDGYVHWYH